MDLPSQGTQTAPTADGDGTARLNALMLVAATFFASAVFAGVATGEGLPVIIGVVIPWLALSAAAAWWFASALRERQADARARAQAIDDARTVAVNLLLADDAPTPAWLAAAELVLAVDPTREDAQALLDRSPGRGQLNESSRSANRSSARPEARDRARPRSGGR